MKKETKRNIAIGTGVVLIAKAALALTGCYDTPDNLTVEQQVTREYNDLTFLGKNVKLIDQTGNAEDLKTRGIWQQIQNGLNASVATPESAFGLKFAAIHDTGNFAIVITSGPGNLSGYSVDGYKVLLAEAQLPEMGNNDIAGIIGDAIMDDMTVAQIKKQNRVRYAGGMSPFELAQTKKHVYVRS